MKMRWFSGDIPDAIKLAKERQCIFIVFIYDASEASQSFLCLIENSKIKELDQCDYVAIKLENGSESVKQFSQIYPLVVIPSLFFISGSSGIPCEIIAGTSSSNDLEEKLKKVFCPQEKGNRPIMDTHHMPAGTDIKNVDNQEAGPSCSNYPESHKISDPEEVEHSKPSEEPAESVATSHLSLEERVDRAKALASEKRVIREKEKEEEEKRKEIERRHTGQEIAKQKQKQQEDDMKTVARERMKDKMDDRIARERVKAQIAADKAEREARAALLRGEIVPGGTSVTSKQSEPSDDVGKAEHDVCRIKFRLPNGSSRIAKFPPDEKISHLFSYVRNNIPLPFANFSLTPALQQDELNEYDSLHTLTNLGLVPSSIIFIRQSSGLNTRVVVSDSSSYFIRLFWYFLMPFTSLWRLLTGLLGRPSSEPKKESPRTRSDTSNAPPRSGLYNQSGEGLRMRREGNVFRLDNGDGDSDENNTWNGNSTQQM